MSDITNPAAVSGGRGFTEHRSKLSGGWRIRCETHAAINETMGGGRRWRTDRQDTAECLGRRRSRAKPDGFDDEAQGLGRSAAVQWHPEHIPKDLKFKLMGVDPKAIRLCSRNNWAARPAR